jgi:hypothetical protein
VHVTRDANISLPASLRFPGLDVIESRVSFPDLRLTVQGNDACLPPFIVLGTDPVPHLNREGSRGSSAEGSC